MIQNKTMVIGITGGTGTGKSTVCSMIKKHCKCVVIDADKIGHKVIKKGNRAYLEILEKFGTGILDKNLEIDRKKLGEIVFSDKEKLKILDSITLKYIKEDIISYINFFKEKQFLELIVIDAPLLIETKLNTVVDKVWVVHSSIEDRIQRLQKRTNLDKEQIIKRINSQNTFEMQKKYADVVIYNTTLCELEQIIKRELKNVLY